MIVYGLVLVIHVLLSLFLIGVILLQGGRGGLGEALGGAAAQSLFGGGANTVMTKITAVSAGLFMVTCLSLAVLPTARGHSSVVDQLPMTLPEPSSAIPTLPSETSNQPPSAPAAPSTSTPNADTTQKP